MGTVKERLADDDNAAYFSDMAKHYLSLARIEQHQAQADLYATIAADYSELAAEAAACMPRTVAAAGVAEPGSLSRWAHWIGRWRHPAPALAPPLAASPLPAVPTGAK